MNGQPDTSLRRPLRLPVLALALVLGAGLGLRAQPPPPASTDSFRFGISASLFTRVNENDAKAAIGSFARAIATRRHQHPAPNPRLFTSIDAMEQSLAADEIMAACMTMPEFWVLQSRFPTAHHMVADYDDSGPERYVLLVHRDAAIATLADLAGKRLIALVNPRTSLALTWLEVELARAGHPAATRHFASVTPTARPNRPAIDVFFRRADACLVSESILRTVFELNPSLRSALRPLARSPAFLTSLIVFRPEADPVIRAAATEEMARLHESPGGSQVLTILRIHRVRPATLEDLRPTLDLLDEHARLLPEAAAARTLALQHQPAPSATVE